MNNNGWVLTSERKPTQTDATSGQIWVMRNDTMYITSLCHFKDSYIAWRPIDKPPEFVPPPKYRNAKFPSDWESVCQFSDDEDFSPVSTGLLIGYCGFFDHPYITHQNGRFENYRYCRKQVDATSPGAGG